MSGSRHFLSRKLLQAGVVAMAALTVAGSTLADTNSYFIDQSRMEIFANPKTNTASGAVKVTSNSNTTVHIKIVPKLWNLDENAAVQYIDPPETGFNLLKNLLINPQEFQLEAGKTQLVRFMVKLPAGVEHAEYAFQLIFEPTDALTRTEPTRQGGREIQQALNIVPIFSTTVYAYQGSPQPGSAIEKFECGHDQTNHHLTSDISLANTGRKHARLLGSIIVNRKEADGAYKPVEIVKLRSGSLIINFPGVPRRLHEVVLPSEKTKTLTPGDYRLELQLADERNEHAALQASCDIRVP